MNRFAMGAFGALCVLACQVPASAQTVKIVASGVVSGGLDTTGVFSAPNTLLTGDAFTFTASFNIANAGHDNDGHRSDIFGGQAYSFLPVDPPSMGGGVLTINGVSQTLHGQWNSLLFAGLDPNSSDDQEVQDLVNDGSLNENSAVVLDERPTFGLFDYPNPVFPSGNLCAAADCSGSNFSFNETLNGVLLQQAFGNLTPTDLTITVSPAPEPASWALMIAGFAGLGGALRSNRRRGGVATEARAG